MSLEDFALGSTSDACMARISEHGPSHFRAGYVARRHQSGYAGFGISEIFDFFWPKSHAALDNDNSIHYHRCMVRGSILFAVVSGSIAFAACSNEVGFEVSPESSTPELGSAVEVSDVPIAALAPDLEQQFREGDALFDLPLRPADGLGPLFTEDHCSACHAGGGRGPGLVEKMSVVLADGVTPAPDQSRLPFGDTVHPQTSGGGKTPVAAPADASIRVTTRVGPPVLGRGYMEAVLDSEIERMAREQAGRSDAIHGRINWVQYASEPNEDRRFHALAKGARVIGRFGLKARIPTLDDFTADAFQGDMGITSPLRPREIANPDGLEDDGKPGVDVGFGSINKRTMYMRLLAIPNRDAAKAERGALLFARAQCATCDNLNRVISARAQCATCHAPSLRTRADYPIQVIAGRDVAVYTDFLLHDMGAALADSARAGTDGTATHRDWRTAPLIGLRFFRTFLHDGRARSVGEAIRAHGAEGSEAIGAVRLYEALSAGERLSLEQYVLSL
jgi:CxxC motif-containing protein (DUF1111 family)